MSEAALEVLVQAMLDPRALDALDAETDFRIFVAADHDRGIVEAALERCLRLLAAMPDGTEPTLVAAERRLRLALDRLG